MERCPADRFHSPLMFATRIIWPYAVRKTRAAISGAGQTLPACALQQVGSLYEAPPVKRFFSRSTFFDSDSVTLTRAHVCIHGTAAPSAWAALSGQPPLPVRVRAFRRGGVDGESARRAIIVLPCIAVSIPMISKAEPLSAKRHSPHPLISGQGQAPCTKVPLATVRGHRAPRRMGPFYLAAY